MSNSKSFTQVLLSTPSLTCTKSHDPGCSRQLADSLKSSYIIERRKKRIHLVSPEIQRRQRADSTLIVKEIRSRIAPMDINAPNISAVEDKNKNLVPTVNLKSMETVSSIVPNITNDEIIDIIDITADDDITLENFQAIDHEKTTLNIYNDEIINITNTRNTNEDVPKQFSCNTKLLDNDLQINNFRTSVQNKSIELITISDNSDDENTSNQQSITKPNSFKSVSKRQDISTICKSRVPYYRYLHNRNRKWEEKNNRKLRPIIIDGLNIGHAHGLGTFSVKGIEICIQFFTDRGHKNVLAFIPVHQQGPPGSESNTRLDNLYKKGQVCFTPSRKINNLRMTCRKDRMMLGYANKCDGVVVSNDNFRDLYDENEAFKKIIENRLVMVTFVKDDIIVPEDQYNGRTNILYLSDILRFPE